MNRLAAFWNAECESDVRRLASRLDYVMAGNGQLLMARKPAEFNVILSNFLRENGLPGS
ncbi:MAG TPA: hypothetical protein VJ776_02955 [Thermoanaerobaculia bacterium]|nr:hypothetical protein [Thermoanaerobaculia bacterium]